MGLERFPELRPEFGEHSRSGRSHRRTRAASDTAGSLVERERCLVKLAITVGERAPGSTQSNRRRSIAAGRPEMKAHIVMLAAATLGPHSAVAATAG